MKFLLKGVAIMAASFVVAPAVAQADSAICHNGVLSDDAGQGCSDGLYAQVYGGGGSSTGGGSSGGICADGILSNDAGQGCSDGLYEQVYGSGGGSGSVAPTEGGSTGWDSVAQCESGGNWDSNTGNGYYGGLQFNSQTWDAYGNPAYREASDAPASEQIAAANRLPYDGWPNC